MLVTSEVVWANPTQMGVATYSIIECFNIIENVDRSTQRYTLINPSTGQINPLSNYRLYSLCPNSFLKHSAVLACSK